MLKFWKEKCARWRARLVSPGYHWSPSRDLAWEQYTWITKGCKLKEVSPQKRAGSCGLILIPCHTLLRGTTLHLSNDLRRRLAQILLFEIDVDFGDGRQAHVVGRTTRKLVAVHVDLVVLVLPHHVVERHETKVPALRTDPIHHGGAIPSPYARKTLVPDKGTDANILFLDGCCKLSSKWHVNLPALNCTERDIALNLSGCQLSSKTKHPPIGGCFVKNLSLLHHLHIDADT